MLSVVTIEITCPDPGTPVNGGRALEGLEYQDTVIFSCDTGYNMQNDPRGPVVCLATGMWSHPTPTCERKRDLYPSLMRPISSSVALCHITKHCATHPVFGATVVNFQYTVFV